MKKAIKEAVLKLLPDDHKAVNQARRALVVAELEYNELQAKFRHLLGKSMAAQGVSLDTHRVCVRCGLLWEGNGSKDEPCPACVAEAQASVTAVKPAAQPVKLEAVPPEGANG